MGIQRRSDQEILAIAPQRDTAGDARGYAASARQTAQHDRSLEFDRLRAAKATTLRAHDQYNASVAERPGSIETDHADWNFHAKARAASGRFGCQDFHGSYRSLNIDGLRQVIYCFLHSLLWQIWGERNVTEVT